MGSESRHEGRRTPWARWSVRVKVSLIASMVLALSATLTSALAIGYVLRQSAERVHRQGETAAREIVALAQSGRVPSQLRPTVPGYYLLQLVDSRGRVLVSSATLDGLPPMTPGGREGLVAVPGAGGHVYVTTYTANTPNGPVTGYAGIPRSPIEANSGALVRGATAACTALVILIALSVWGAVHRTLRPVEHLREELDRIGPADLDKRVTEPGTDDEVGRLARSVNATLRRLERTVQGQRRFVADVSHELRSPLTGLRTQLEVALSHPKDEDWPAVAEAALNDAERLQNIVTDLLILARIESGGQLAADDRIDLGELVGQEVGRQLRRVTAETDLASGVTVLGNRSHLRRLVVNLLDNAARHAESGVCAQVAVEEGRAVLRVTDDGEGIAPEDREEIFRRFVRLAESRRRDAGGTGLGLSIARDIATAHGGTLAAEDSARGACFVLRLPPAPGEAPDGAAPEDAGSPPAGQP